MSQITANPLTIEPLPPTPTPVEAQPVTLTGSPSGNGIPVTPSSVNPLPSILANTIGKLKACGARWTINYYVITMVAGVNRQILPANDGRVFMAVFTAAAADTLFSGAMDITKPGWQIGAAPAAFQQTYDDIGPIIGQQWSFTFAFGGDITVVEIVANN